MSEFHQAVRRSVGWICTICLFFPVIASAFDLQGHRGARGLLPENTLPAFARALAIGVTTLELDTGISADGVVVVSHNQKLDQAITRHSSGKWLAHSPVLNSLSVMEIQQYDVGRIDPASRLASRFPDQQGMDAVQIPTLEDVFALVKKSGNQKVRFNIESKINPLQPDLSVDPDQFASHLLAVINSHELASRVSIQSFDWRTLEAVQKMQPTVQTVYLTAQQKWLNNVAEEDGKASPWTAGIKLSDFAGSVAKMVHAAGGTVWSPFHGDLNKDELQIAHDLGLEVVVWTVNDKAQMRGLIAMGVDGIISDYPDRLREVMSDLKMSLPAPSPVDL